jgi:DivIVA domain-containing protein
VESVDRENATRGGFEGGDPASPAKRVTPDDVQRKEFGTARVRVGYLMHEVDEFLDEITDTLSSLASENERLRDQLAASPGAGAPIAAPPPVARPADRAAVEAFLQREKAFLQSLGSLVQEHAEELRGMVRAARSGPIAPSEEPDVRSAAAPAEPETAAAPAPTPEPESEPERAPEAPIVAAAADEAPTPDPDDDVATILDGGADDTRAIDAVPADEPIVVDEPEPTGSRRRREEQAEGSLRELFWGEE